MIVPPFPDEPTRSLPDADFPPTLQSDGKEQGSTTADTLLPEFLDRRKDSLDVVPGYEILGELGRGGMGVVYKARQVGLNRIVALKMILAGSHASAEERTRFRREAEAIARLQHPNIVQVYDVHEHNGQPYFSLEFCGGGTLAEKLTGTPLPPKQAARLLIALARGVHHAHAAGIVHRDLKPGNILLGLQSAECRTQNGKEPAGAAVTVAGSLSSSGQSATCNLQSAIPKVTDFGLAKCLDSHSNTRDGDVMGTPSYMSPEQAAGKVTRIGPHTDTYALGAILYELLTGRPPFVAASPMETIFQVITRDPVPVRALQPRTPRDLETIALKCLQKEPTRRYSTAGGLADDLERFLDGKPILARPVGAVEACLRWTRRNPWRAAMAGSVALALAVVVAGWVWFTRQLSVKERLANEKAAEAVEQRALAVERRKQAEANEERAKKNEALAESWFLESLLVADQYFTEVSESTLLNEPGMQPLRRELLRKARGFYAKFVRQRRDDPRLKGELARSVYRLGVIDGELDDLPGGVAQLYDGLAEFDQLLSGKAADVRLMETRARLLNDLGRLERRRSRFGLAAEAYRKALEAWERLDRDTASSRVAREGLARCLLGLGNVELDQDHRQEALKYYLRSRDLRRELVAADPANEGYQRDLAMTWQNLASLHARLKQTREAEEACEQALSTFRQLATAHPSRASYRQDLGLACYNEGHRLMRAEEWEPAIARFDEAVREFEFLVFTNPGVDLHLTRLGHALYNRAVCLDEDDQPEAADAEYGKARNVRRHLATSHPMVPDYQVAYAQCLRRDGDRALNKDKAQAAEAFRQARDVLKKAPASPEGQFLLAVVLMKLGMLADKPEEAAPLFEQARAEAQALVRQKQLADRAARLEKEIEAERKKRLKK